METERKEAAREDVGHIPPIAAVSPADEAEVKEIPAAPAQTGQLQHERWEPYYRLLLPTLTQSMFLWSVYMLI
jgi:hypothetical protein